MSAPSTYAECRNAYDEFVSQTKNVINTDGDFLTNAIVFIQGLKQLNVRVKKTGKDLGFDIDNDTYTIFENIKTRLDESISWSHDILSLLEIDKDSPDAFQKAKKAIESYKGQITDCRAKLESIKADKDAVIKTIVDESAELENYVQNYQTLNIGDLKFSFLESLKQAVYIKLKSLDQMLVEKDQHINNLENAHQKAIETIKMSHDAEIQLLKRENDEKISKLTDGTNKTQLSLMEEKNTKIIEIQQEFFNSLQRLRAHLMDLLASEIKDEQKKFISQIKLEGKSIEERQIQIKNHVREIQEKYDDLLENLKSTYSKNIASLEVSLAEQRAECEEEKSKLNNDILNIQTEKENIDKYLKVAKENVKLLNQKIDEKEEEIRAKVNLGIQSELEKKELDRMYEQNKHLINEKNAAEKNYRELQQTYEVYKQSCEKSIQDKTREIDTLEKKHKLDIQSIKREKDAISKEYTAKIEKLEKKMKQELETCQKDCADEIEKLSKQKIQEIERLTEEHDEQLIKVRTTYQKALDDNSSSMEADCLNRIDKLKREYDEKEKEQAEIMNRLQTAQDKEIETLKQNYEKQLQIELNRLKEIHTIEYEKLRDREIALLNETSELKTKLKDECIYKESMDTNTQYYKSMNFNEKQIYLEALSNYLLRIQKYLQSKNLNYPDDLKAMVAKLIQDYLKLRIDIDAERKTHQSEIASLKYQLQIQETLYKQTKDSIDRYNQISIKQETMDTEEKNKDVSRYLYELNAYKSYVSDLKLLYELDVDMDDITFKNTLINFKKSFKKLQIDYEISQSNLKDFFDNINKLFGVYLDADVSTHAQLMQLVEKLMFREKVNVTYISEINRLNEEFVRTWLLFSSMSPENVSDTATVTDVKDKLSLLMTNIQSQIKQLDVLENLILENDDPAQELSLHTSRLVSANEKNLQEMSQLNIRIDTLKKKNVTLTNTTTDLEQKLSDRKQDLKNVRSELDTCKKEVNKHAQKIKSLEKNLQSVFDDQNTSENKKQRQIATLESEIYAQQESINQKDDELRKKNSQIDELENDIDDLQKKYDSKKSELEELKLELNEARLGQQTLSKQYNEMIEKHKKILADQVKLTNSANTDYQNTLKKVAELERNLNASKSTIAAKDSRIEGFLETIGINEQSIQTATNTITRLQEENKQLNDKIVSLDKDIRKLYAVDTENESLKLDLDDKTIKITQLNETIQNNLQKIENLEIDIGNHVNAIDDQSSKIDQLNLDVDEKNKLIEQLNKSIDDYKSTSEKNKSNIGDLESTISNLQETIKLQATYQAENKKHLDTIASKDKELKSYRDEIKTLEDDVKDRQASIKNLQKNLDEKTSEAATHLLKIDNLKAEINGLKNSINLQTEIIKETNESIDDLKQKNITLNQTLEENKNKISTLNNQLNFQLGKVAEYSGLERNVLSSIARLLKRISNLMEEIEETDEAMSIDDPAENMKEIMDKNLSIIFQKIEAVWEEKKDLLNTTNKQIKTIQQMDTTIKESKDADAKNQELIQKLQQQIDNYTTANSILSSEKLTLENKVYELEQSVIEKNSIDNSLSLMHKDRDLHKDKCDALQKSLSQKASEYKILEKKLNNEKKTLQQKINEFQQLNLEKQNLEKALLTIQNDRDEKIKDYNKVVKELQNQSNEYEKYKSELTTKNVDLEGQIQEFKKLFQKKQDLEKEIQTITKDHEYQVEQHNVVVSDIAKKTAEYEELKALIEVSNQTKLVLEQSVQELKNLQKVETDKIAELKKDMDNAVNQKASLAVAISKAKAELEEVNDKIKRRTDIKLQKTISEKREKDKEKRFKLSPAFTNLTEKVESLTNDTESLKKYLEEVAENYTDLLLTYSGDMPMNMELEYPYPDPMETDNEITRMLYTVQNKYIELKNLLDQKTRLYNELVKEKNALLQTQPRQIQELKAQSEELKNNIKKYQIQLRDVQAKHVENKKDIFSRMGKKISEFVTFERNVASKFTNEVMEPYDNIIHMYQQYIIYDNGDIEPYQQEMEKVLKLIDDRLSQISIPSPSQSNEYKQQYDKLSEQQGEMLDYVKAIYDQCREEQEKLKKLATSTKSIFETQYIQTQISNYESIMTILKSLLVSTHNIKEINVEKINHELGRLKKLWTTQMGTLGIKYQETIQKVYPDAKILDTEGNLISTQTLMDIEEKFNQYIDKVQNIYNQIPEKFRNINFKEFFTKLDQFTERFEDFNIDEFVMLPRTIRYLVETFEAIESGNPPPDPNDPNFQESQTKYKSKSIAQLFGRLKEIAENANAQKKFYENLIKTDYRYESVLDQYKELQKKMDEYKQKCKSAFSFKEAWKDKLGFLRAWQELDPVHTKHFYKVMSTLYAYMPSSMTEIFDAFTILLDSWLQTEDESNVSFYKFLSTVDYNQLKTQFGTYYYLSPDDQETAKKSIRYLHRKEEKKIAQAERQEKRSGSRASITSTSKSPQKKMSRKQGSYSTFENLANIPEKMDTDSKPQPRAKTKNK